MREINLDKLRVLDKRNGKVYAQISSLEWHNSHVAVHVHDPESEYPTPGMEWPIDCAILIDDEFTCPEGWRTPNSFCGKEVDDPEECHRCCFGCKHAIDMDCVGVCPHVAEHYHPEDEDSDTFLKGGGPK
jgi:hypothetical protein